MKVLFVVSSAGAGGGETAALTVARGVAAAGNTVLVAGRGGGRFEAATRAAGLAFADGCPGDGVDVLGLARLARLVRAERVDLVHAHLNRGALWASLAGRACGVPVVATAHGMTSALYYRFAHRVIAVSHAVAEHLGRQVPALAGRTRVIHNPLELDARPDAARAAALRAELGGDRAPLALIAAKLHPNKGQRLAIEALARLPDARLVLAGDGPDEANLRALAARVRMTERVVFLGQRDDVRDLMAAVDVVLVPSEHEAFSLAAAEALLAGTPVVAQRTGGVPEVVGEDGVLVDTREPGAWAAAVAGVLADVAAARARAGRAAARLRALGDPASVLARTRDVYRELVR